MRYFSLGGAKYPRRRSNASRAAVSASLDAISNADAALSRLVIAAGLKLIVVPIDSTWMRRSLASGSRAKGFPRQQCQSGSLPPAPVEVGRFRA
jgi:hypothetical protein